MCVFGDHMIEEWQARPVRSVFPLEIWDIITVSVSLWCDLLWQVFFYIFSLRVFDIVLLHVLLVSLVHRRVFCVNRRESGLGVTLEAVADVGGRDALHSRRPATGGRGAG